MRWANRPPREGLNTKSVGENRTTQSAGCRTLALPGKTCSTKELVKIVEVHFKLLEHRRKIRLRDYFTVGLPEGLLNAYVRQGKTLAQLYCSRIMYNPYCQNATQQPRHAHVKSSANHAIETLLIEGDP